MREDEVAVVLLEHLPRQELGDALEDGQLVAAMERRHERRIRVATENRRDVQDVPGGGREIVDAPRDDLLQRLGKRRRGRELVPRASLEAPAAAGSACEDPPRDRPAQELRHEERVALGVNREEARQLGGRVLREHVARDPRHRLFAQASEEDDRRVARRGRSVFRIGRLRGRAAGTRRALPARRGPPTKPRVRVVRPLEIVDQERDGAGHRERARSAWRRSA
ncbi:MAG: hypothetical protein U0166_16160 [Acidobacteriota bacterium]